MDPHELAAIARRHGVQLIVQHGSTVSGRMHALSDVDLGVLLGRPPDRDDRFYDLVGALQTLWPDREVDVARLDGADPLLLHRVVTHGRLLYGSPRPHRRLVRPQVRGLTLLGAARQPAPLDNTRDTPRHPRHHVRHILTPRSRCTGPVRERSG